MEISSIGQIAVTVHDLDRATGFYRDLLNLKHLFSFPRLSFFQCGGVRLMLTIPEKPEFDHPSSIIYFKVADIQRSYRELRDLGVVFESPPALIAPMETHDLWLAEFRDSESNIMCLMAEVPKATENR